MDNNQLLRYSRQILLPQVGVEGQERLLKAKVLIIGMGGLGSPAAMYLAAAGIGHLFISDFDKVDLSNLQRQIIHRTTDIGRYKVDSARDTLLALNPLITVTPLYQQWDNTNLSAQVAEVDVVLDCSDNLPTRLAINQACVQTQTPLVSGAAVRLEGQISVFSNHLPASPCYNCLYSHRTIPEATCSQTGILAPIVGIIGSLQALEAMKLIMAVGEVLMGKLLLLDALKMEWYTIKLAKNPHCQVCNH